jgi:hypothetical protein
MAYAIAHRTKDQNVRALWAEVIDDLRPAPGAARVTASIVGLAELLKWLGRLGQDPKVIAVKDAVRALHETLNKVAGDDLNDYWRETLIKTTDAVRGTVEEALSVGPISDTTSTIKNSPTEIPESGASSVPSDRGKDAS